MNDRPLGFIMDIRNRPHMASDSLIPVDFWRDHPDEEVRAFYGVLNDKTREYLEIGGLRITH